MHVDVREAIFDDRPDRLDRSLAIMLDDHLIGPPDSLAAKQRCDVVAIQGERYAVRNGHAAKGEHARPGRRHAPALRSALCQWCLEPRQAHYRKTRPSTRTSSGYSDRLNGKAALWSPVEGDYTVEVYCSALTEASRGTLSVDTARRV